MKGADFYARLQLSPLPHTARLDYVCLTGGFYQASSKLWESDVVPLLLRSC